MATVFLAVGAALKGAAAGATAAGTTAAAATGTAAAAGGLTLKSALVTASQVLSVGSALAAIGQGYAAKSSLEAQASQREAEAAFAQAQAAQEEAQGAARARDLAREYAELRSEQTIIQLANGLDIGVGTPVAIAEATKKQAERNLSVTRENTRNRARMSRLRSRGLMTEASNSLRQGNSAVTSGYVSAFGTALDAYQMTG